MSKIAKSGLYSPARERDACGFGFVARVDGRRTRETGAGGGILLQIPDAFPRRECEDLGIELTPAGGYRVGVLFEFEREEGRAGAERGRRGPALPGLEDVPGEPGAAGRLAWSIIPRIR